VDGVEMANGVYRAVLDLEAGDIARLELHVFAETVFEGEVPVEIVHVCPECKERLVKNLEPGMAATTETTAVGSQWKRHNVVAVKTDDGEIVR